MRAVTVAVTLKAGNIDLFNVAKVLNAMCITLIVIGKLRTQISR